MPVRDPDPHKRQRRNQPGPTAEELAERVKIEGDADDALRVLLGVKPKKPVRVKKGD